MQQKLRINQCNHMLDKKRAEMEKSRVLRQKRLEEEVLRYLCPTAMCPHTTMLLYIMRTRGFSDRMDLKWRCFDHCALTLIALLSLCLLARIRCLYCFSHGILYRICRDLDIFRLCLCCTEKQEDSQNAGSRAEKTDRSRTTRTQGQGPPGRDSSQHRGARVPMLSTMSHSTFSVLAPLNKNCAMPHRYLPSVM